MTPWGGLPGAVAWIKAQQNEWKGTVQKEVRGRDSLTTRGGSIKSAQSSPKGDPCSTSILQSHCSLLAALTSEDTGSQSVSKKGGPRGSARRVILAQVSGASSHCDPSQMVCVSSSFRFRPNSFRAQQMLPTPPYMTW